LEERNFTFQDPSGHDLFVYRWRPDREIALKGIVLIAHGMVETAGRYRRFAAALTEAGYVVYAADHRGHGKSARVPEELGILGADGFQWMVRNLIQLADIAASEQEKEGLPLFVFGHSMGSFIAQMMSFLAPQRLSGVILSACTWKKSPLLQLGILLAKAQAKWLGEGHRSKLLNSLTFAGYNKAFKPKRTDFDWLSRDEAEVDLYVADPHCGVVPSASFFRELYLGVKELYRKEHWLRLPKRLPFLLLAGDKDPFSHGGRDVLRLYSEYKEAGLEQVDVKLYPGARHEILNEINRDEVMGDAIAWLDRHTV
jgi:alpha-beta hydrolase superfamily lysophospholipase